MQYVHSFLVDDRDVDEVALLRRKPCLLGDAPQGGVGLECDGTLGQHAVQIRNEPPGFLNTVQNPGRSRRRGRRVVKRETVDHLSSPSNDVA